MLDIQSTCIILAGMIERDMKNTLLLLADKYPVVVITGPRQSGKTTLCKITFPDKAYVNLEMPDIRQYAIDDPRSFLSDYTNGAILDEIQRAPELLSYIQGMVDEDDQAGRFILTGSQQFELMHSVTQTLAGRVGLLKLLPCSLAELQRHGIDANLDTQIFTGSYPRIYDKKLHPTQAMGDYFETYVQRDIRQLVQLKNVAVFETFVRLCAGRVGQLLNLSSLGADAGISHATAREWINLLEASYIIFQLRPWHANISKRLVKSPKLYFYDTGLASYLLGMESTKHIHSHPLRGSLFENMAIVEALKFRLNRGKRSNLSFYRDSGGHEVDLLLTSGSDIFPIEIKSGATTNRDYFKGLNFFSKLENISVTHGAVIYGGDNGQVRGAWQVCSIQAMESLLQSLDDNQMKAKT